MHNSEQLVEYALAVSSFVHVLQSQNYYEDLNGSTNLALVVQKLPPNLRESWSRHVVRSSLQRPTLLHFNSWLGVEAESHEYMRSTATPTPKTKPPENTKPKAVKAFASNSSAPSAPPPPPAKCVLCGKPHPLYKCDTLKPLTPTQRALKVKEHNQCFACLNGEHHSSKCPRSFKCGVDGCVSTSHNRLLHGAKKVFGRVAASANVASSAKPLPSAVDPPNAPPLAPKTQPPVKATTSSATSSLVARIKGLLQVAEVRVRGPRQTLTTLALFDSGSTNSWCDDSFATNLGFTQANAEALPVIGLHKEQVVNTREISVVVSSVSDKNVRFNVTPLTKEDFVVGRDRVDIRSLKQSFPHLAPLPDLVIDYSQVKILLGQDAFAAICPIEVSSVDNRTPCAVRTPLGWVASGPLPSKVVKGVSNFKAVVNDDSLAAQLHSWWDIESYAASRSVDPRAKSDRRAVELLESTTRHNGTRYEVGMLWADSDAPLPNNYYAALAQFKSLSNRLDKDPPLRERYARTISDDLAKGFVVKLTPEQLLETRSHPRIWYLPHHPVINPNKPDKIRRVLNGASKFRGTSLHDSLLTGPDFLRNLVGILVRFREGSVAISADIEGMFLQVGVPSADQPCLRFLWAEESTSPSGDVPVHPSRFRR